MRRTSAARRRPASFAALAPAVVGLSLLAAPPLAVAKRPPCPGEMVNVAGRFCIDRYEASLLNVDARGRSKKSHSPYESPAGKRVRARSVRGVVPQAYISQVDAASACAEAGKRLCSDDEWVSACRGKRDTQFPYGAEREAGYCNDAGVSPLLALHGKPTAELFSFEIMNDPKLNQVPGSLARSGAFRRCKSSAGVFDLVGNLHEWTADPNGTFRGGYYLDTHLNGDGCAYATKAHIPAYHDYSIGFRCCEDLRQTRSTKKAAPAAKKAAHRPRPVDPLAIQL